MAKDKEVVLQLRLKPATAAELKTAFANVHEEAGKAGGRIKSSIVDQTGGGSLGNVFKSIGGKAGAGEAAAGGEAAGAEGAAGALGPVGAAFAGLAIGAVVVGKAITAVIDQFQQWANTAIELARAANPAIAKQFDLAIADATAVMGRVFVPVMELATSTIRIFGDFMSSILPSSGEVRAALAPLNDVLAELREAAGDIAPYIRTALLGSLMLLGEGLKWLAGVFKGVWKEIRDFLGIAANQKGLASSQGASASTASFSSIEEYSRQNQLRAFGAGAESPMKLTETELAAIRKAVDNIVEWLTGNKAGEKIGGGIGAGAANAPAWGHKVDEGIKLGRGAFGGIG